MNPREQLGAFGSPGDVQAQVDALGGSGRGGGTRRLAERWAASTGKSVSSQMRAVQRAFRSGRPPARQDRSVAEQGEALAAAERIRTARTFRGGTVTVKYNGKSQGTRDLGSFDIGGLFAADMAGIADLIEQGRYDEAQERLSEAALDEYGNLGGTLTIDEYESGIILE